MYLPDRRDQLECPGDCILRCALDRLFSFLFSFPSFSAHAYACTVSQSLASSVQLALPQRLLQRCCSADDDDAAAAAAVLMMMLMMMLLMMLIIVC